MDTDNDIKMQERTPLRQNEGFEEMASCPSNLNCAGGQANDCLIERSYTAKGVLYTTYNDKATATILEKEAHFEFAEDGTSILVPTKDSDLMARASSPSSIYYIPESTFTQRPSIDIKVNSLSYTVNPRSLSWWQKLSTMQLPWEWMDSSEPQQVLNNVSFSIASGQMLAIMGNSGKR